MTREEWITAFIAPFGSEVEQAAHRFSGLHRCGVRRSGPHHVSAAVPACLDACEGYALILRAAILGTPFDEAVRAGKGVGADPIAAILTGSWRGTAISTCVKLARQRPRHAFTRSVAF